MAEKRFYWIKLHTNFFEKEQIDFLMSQKDGANYIVLYQMLCMKTANNNGLMASTIGEMIVPYDVDKIVRDCKYFSKDTVIVALELYKKLGLIYLDQNNTLQIANYDEIVGSETSSAKRVREYRQKKALQCNTNVTQEYRYKILDNRYKILDKDIELNKEKVCKKENKHKHGTYGRVLLTDKQLEKLKADYGEEFIMQAIDRLDEYVQSNNNKNHYTDFNLVLRKAIREKWSILQDLKGCVIIEDKKNSEPSLIDYLKTTYNF